jgi:hypothetical protein
MWFMCIVSLYSFVNLLSNFQRAAVGVGLNGALVEHRHGHLGVRGLRAQLVVGVTHALANSVNTNQSAGAQEVLALQGARAHGVLLGPHAVLVLGEELGGGQLVPRVASLGGLGISEGGRALIPTQRGGTSRNIGVAHHCRAVVCAAATGEVRGLISERSR